ncbi:MAG: NADAR family protein [Brevundimonas sp.]|nr:NADAR family protein [Brevundimonas sp.]
MTDARPQITEADLPKVEAFDSFHPFIKGVFSQWHPTPFTLEGLSLATAEQWMMVGKARLFGDEAAASAILATPDPAEQKRLGQTVRDFDQAIWDLWKIDIVHRGNRAKFSQNEGAARQLKATARSMLVEANPRDWIWGVGLHVDDVRAHDPAEWRGSNLLGRILTGIRDELK